MVEAAAEHVHRLHVEVAGALDRGEHEARAALAGHGAVEQAERIGDHRRVQHVLGRDHAVRVDGVGVHPAVRAHRRGDLGEVLGLRAVEVHVSLGDERELGRRV